MEGFDHARPVAVTGSTGYVAGWLVSRLLREGFLVHAPVRDAENSEKLKYLNDMADASPGKIRFFDADLLTPGSYDEAIQGCSVVFHTASPFINKVKDPQRDLVDPALKGTRNVLESVSRASSVERVVLTSSVAAIIGDAADLLALPGQMADESNWNTSSSLDHQAYSFSKTIAEQEAWSINRKQNRWELVVINPSLVIGPGLQPFGSSESYRIFKQLADGSLKFGAPAFEIGVVDVRDVAEAYFRAGFYPHASGRHIISARPMSLLQMGTILRKVFGDSYPFPQKEMPKWLVWLMAPAVGVKRKMVSRNMGFSWKVDNKKAIRELGMAYRPVEESVTDFFSQMTEAGIIRPK
jgi:nucleoside-diphosphate-sugar epimerase